MVDNCCQFITIQIPFWSIILLHTNTYVTFQFSQGMVDSGEQVSATLKREFGEEALNSIDQSEEDKQKLSALIGRVFDNGVLVRWFFTNKNKINNVVRFIVL